MKQIINSRSLALAVIISTSLFSCMKDFDAASYAPEKPIGGYSSSADIGTGHLVDYWGFNGNLNDSINPESAGVNAGTTFAAGIKGQSLQGADKKYVTFTPSTALQNLSSFTVAFWMKPTTNKGAIGIFGLSNTKDFWGSLDIYTDNGGNGDTIVFKVHINNSNVPWAGQFTDTKITGIGKWVHVVASYDAASSKFNIYLNGQVLGVNSAANTANTTGPVLHGDDPASHSTPYGALKFVNATAAVFGAFQFQTNPSLTTSADAQDWATNFAGNLDEFRIYDKALSAGDVHSLYLLESLGR